MILPRKLIDNFYINIDFSMHEQIVTCNSFECRLYDVLATTDWWPKVSTSDDQMLDLFYDAYYIVTLSLMRKKYHPEYWCDDFFNTAGFLKDPKCRYQFVKERQWAVMSIVLCVFSRMDEEKLLVLMCRIEQRLKKDGTYELVERMLNATKGEEYKQYQSKYICQELYKTPNFEGVNWYNYITVFDRKNGDYISGDIQRLLAIIGSGKPEEDVGYPTDEELTRRVLGKMERLRLASTLKKFFEREEAKQEKDHNSPKKQKKFNELFEDLDWCKGALDDWLRGIPRWKSDEDVYWSLESYSEEYANEIVYPYPDWFREVDIWPRITLKSFVYFYDPIKFPIEYTKDEDIDDQPPSVVDSKGEEEKESNLEAGIRRSLEKLMQERITVKKNGKDEEEFLFSLQNHWQGVYRILVDKEYCMDSDFEGFDTFIVKVMPENVNKPYKKDSVQQISKTDFDIPFEKWKYNGKTSGRRKAYDRMCAVAKRFKELLEEEGL